MNEVEKLIWEEARLQRVFASQVEELLEACRTALKADGYGVQDRVRTSEASIRNKWFKIARDPLGELRFSISLHIRLYERVTKIELIFIDGSQQVLQSWGTELGDEALRAILAKITPARLLETLRTAIHNKLGPRNPKAWMPGKGCRTDDP